MKDKSITHFGINMVLMTRVCILNGTRYTKRCSRYEKRNLK